MRSGPTFDAQPAEQPSPLAHAPADSGAAPARIAVTGTLGQRDAAALQRAVIDVLRHDRPGRIDVDLTAVPAIDTGGIMALLLCQADARQVDCEIRLTGARPLVYRTLQIAGLLEHFGLARATSVPPTRAGSGPAVGLVHSGLAG